MKGNLPTPSTQVVLCGNCQTCVNLTGYKDPSLCIVTLAEATTVIVPPVVELQSTLSFANCHLKHLKITMIKQRNEKFLYAEDCHLPGNLEIGGGNHQSLEREHKISKVLQGWCDVTHSNVG